MRAEQLAELNPNSRLVMYGQDLNPESYAICKADMLIKGLDIANIIFGNMLSNDGLLGKQFDYMLSNPPFGVEWKKIRRYVLENDLVEAITGRPISGNWRDKADRREDGAEPSAIQK